jgi:hypothetical protein
LLKFNKLKVQMMLSQNPHHQLISTNKLRHQYWPKNADAAKMKVIFHNLFPAHGQMTPIRDQCFYTVNFSLCFRLFLCKKWKYELTKEKNIWFNSCYSSQTCIVDLSYELIMTVSCYNEFANLHTTLRLNLIYSSCFF